MHSQCGVDIRWWWGALRHQYTPLQHSRLLWALKGEKRINIQPFLSQYFTIFVIIIILGTVARLMTVCS